MACSLCPLEHTRDGCIYYWDEVWIGLKTDALQDCVLAIAGGHVLLINTLIIDLSHHMVQHALVL